MKTKEKFLEKLNKVEDFLFKPHSCMFCGTECDDEVFRTCNFCKAKLDKIENDFCLKCGTKLNGTYDFCIECKSDEHLFNMSRSVFVYDELSSRAILKFKYGGAKPFAKPLAKYLAEKFSTSDLLADVATFVPMPKEREKKRGYNQSFELCSEFCSLTGLPFKACLERTRNSERQTTLNKEDRKKNLNGSFRAINKADFKNKIVLLIDDVVTTGATADECAKTLLNAGAVEVNVLSIAKTPVLYK